MFNIKLTAQEGDLIMFALSKLPYENVSGLIANLQAQAAAQIEQVNAEVPSEPEAEPAEAAERE